MTKKAHWGHISILAWMRILQMQTIHQNIRRIMGKKFKTNKLMLPGSMIQKQGKEDRIGGVEALL